jgi:cholesterol transport system auxiliary component
MKRRVIVLAGTTSLLAGCISVSIGSGDVPPSSFYELTDARPAPPAAPAAGTAPRIALQAMGADPIADSTAIVYSRRDGERAFYQFASWTERPSVRLVQLAQHRLESRGRFAAVTQLGQPVESDWLLTFDLETLVHDVSVTPGRAQLTLRAELIHRRERRLVAWRSFSAAPPVAEPAAPAAVAAFAVATADVLDQLAEWVEASVVAFGKR